MKNGLHINEYGVKYWYKDNLLHREDGPALISKEVQEWWLNGQCHRLDGPAVIYKGGIQMWYLYGKFISYRQSEFINHIIQHNIKSILSCDSI